VPKHRPHPIRERVRRYARERGAWWVARRSAAWAAGYALGLPLSLRPPRRTFTFGGREYRYLHHRYHYTWLNERAVEVPIAAAALEERRGGRVLELGNVLSHYLPVDHTIVDKYEHAPGVINEDVLDLPAHERYDLILSISTLEHVGYEEDPRDPEKAGRAVTKLVELLEPGGRLLATFPAGFNLALDEQVRSGVLPFNELRAMRRVSPLNRWREVPLEAVWDAEYDPLLYTPGGIVICET
jgi:hypothetical protein